MKLNRDIATVAGLQVVLFSVLTHFEPQFFLLHLYQTIIYMAILILLAGAARQVLRLMRGQAVSNDVSFIAAISAVLAVLMIIFCARHWKREYAGVGKTATTFAISLGVVAVYYGILAIWFWNMIPTQIANG